jgi:hypothetical protein
VTLPKLASDVTEVVTAGCAAPTPVPETATEAVDVPLTLVTLPDFPPEDVGLNRT